MPRLRRRVDEPRERRSRADLVSAALLDSAWELFLSDVFAARYAARSPSIHDFVLDFATCTQTILDLYNIPGVEVKVLIVDDDAIDVTILRQLVERLPQCHAIEFARLDLALIWCKNNETDLVIVKHLMPGFDGIEFTRQLRSFAPKTELPLIVLTVTEDEEVREAALEAGANRVLNKPFSFADLHALATKMLAARAAYKRVHDAAAIPKKPVLDVNATLQRLSGDRALLVNVAVAFLRSVPELLASINEALFAKDHKRALAQMRALKSAVAAFDAPVVFKCLLNVEKYAKDAEGPAVAAAFRLAHELVEQLTAELRVLAAAESTSERLELRQTPDAYRTIRPAPLR
jgi:CheY-like chemotaxis protein